MSDILYVAGERSISRLVSHRGGSWAGTGASELPARVMAITVAERATGPVLYAVATADDGTLMTIGERDGVPVVLAAVATGGPVPCSISVAATGRFLAVANYRSGTVGIHDVDDEGRAGPVRELLAERGDGPDPRRQDQSHVHSVLRMGADDLISVDLGADAVRVHPWDSATGSLGAPAVGSTARGAGPRHAVVVRDRWIVTADELGPSVSLLRWDGEIRSVNRLDRQSLPLGVGSDVRDYPSDVVVAGEYLYVATRGADVITQFAIRGDRLVAIDEVPCGRWPMKLAVVDGRLLCAARDDDAVVDWAIDPHTGRLGDRQTVAEVARPVWVAPALR